MQWTSEPMTANLVANHTREDLPGALDYRYLCIYIASGGASVKSDDREQTLAIF